MRAAIGDQFRENLGCAGILFAFEQANAQVMAGADRPRIARIALDEVGPGAGGQVVLLAILQGGGGRILPAGHVDLWPRLGQARRPGSDCQGQGQPCRQQRGSFSCRTLKFRRRRAPARPAGPAMPLPVRVRKPSRLGYLQTIQGTRGRNRCKGPCAL